MDYQLSSKLDTKKKILLGALDCFAEKGYEGTTMDDIVRISGISKGSLYFHFDNKRDLFLNLVDYLNERTRFYLIDAYETDSSPWQQIKHFVTGPFLLQKKEKIISRCGAELLNLSTRDTVINQKQTRSFKDYEEFLLSQILDGNSKGIFSCPDPEQTAFLIMTLVMGINIRILIRPEYSQQKNLDFIEKKVAEILGFKERK